MNSADESYVGRVEGKQLDFKGPEASDEDLLIPITAFLNTDGGTLVVGVTDAGGREVAEPGVKEPHALLERVSRKIETEIEPSPARLVTGRIVTTPSGTRLVVYEVSKPADSPYAIRKGMGLHFFWREGAQNRNMSMHEILRRARQSPPSDDPEQVAAERLRPGIATAEAGAFGGGVALLAGFFPARQPSLDRQENAMRRVIELLNSEFAFDMQPDARNWTLGLAPYFSPRREGDAIRFGREKPLARFAEIKSSGLVWGSMRLEPGGPGLSGQGRQGLRVFDYAVRVFLTSVAQLTKVFWEALGIEGVAYARSILFAQHKVGWQSLKEGIGYRPSSELADPPLDSGAIQIDAGRLISSPDGLASDLLLRLVAPCFGSTAGR